MTDDQLIDLIAHTWITNGGDLLGFEYSWTSIRNRIEEIEEFLKRYKNEE